jgi:hypothetical protein
VVSLAKARIALPRGQGGARRLPDVLGDTQGDQPNRDRLWCAKGWMAGVVPRSGATLAVGRCRRSTGSRASVQGDPRVGGGRSHATNTTSISRLRLSIKRVFRKIARLAPPRPPGYNHPAVNPRLPHAPAVHRRPCSCPTAENS